MAESDPNSETDHWEFMTEKGHYVKNADFPIMPKYTNFGHRNPVGLTTPAPGYMEFYHLPAPRLRQTGLRRPFPVALLDLTRNRAIVVDFDGGIFLFIFNFDNILVFLNETYYFTIIFLN